MTVVAQVADSDMPHLFQAADQASLEAQKSYVGGTRKRLLLLSAAAVAGLSSWRVGTSGVDVWGVLGVITFVGALILELSAWRTRPDKAWYDGRAVAESSKTLAWKFAVCALPFPREIELDDARVALMERFEAIQHSFRGLELSPIVAPAISSWMIEQRTSSLEDRRSSYLEARIADQKKWYMTKATFNRKRATAWRRVLVSCEFLGVVTALFAALMQGFAQVSPAIAAVVVAIVAWTETKQYDFNARAYAAAVNDLTNAEEKLRLAVDESSWAKEVDDAEEAISREHVVWWATRSRV
ncbi:DUF4231 domain-containing protein [Gordonia sp. KTR9]|uniref:DUF4231 domain-containing protein n=1 Tax=Gordonia sp. KTR9 TaxID=337191 RepID=UPI00027DDDE6|nr:DUF4231 domain-containing protein [Gordonia sp. KTR9]AFR46713.1 integral membrane protein [Gordonia sp. KTR9]